jgi:hypothetical protein
MITSSDFWPPHWRVDSQKLAARGTRRISKSTTLSEARVGGGLEVTSLTYEYAPKDTATVDGKIAGNFPLDIEGTDIASGQAFHYRYDASSETMAVVPEPSAIMLVAAAVCVMALRCRNVAGTLRVP